MIKFKEKLSYGFGSFGYSIISTFTLGYFVLFATDVLNISPVIVGGIFLLEHLCVNKPPVILGDIKTL